MGRARCPSELSWPDMVTTEYIRRRDFFTPFAAR
jgi:hypothetical protein